MLSLYFLLDFLTNVFIYLNHVRKGDQCQQGAEGYSRSFSSQSNTNKLVFGFPNNVEHLKQGSADRSVAIVWISVSAGAKK